MKSQIQNFFALGAFAVGAALCLLLVGSSSELAFAQEYGRNEDVRAPRYQGYEDIRDAVQRTQDDLQRVRREGARNNKERERIDNARKHLSDFDRNLNKNKFDKDRLDSAIDDVKNVVEHDTLEARDRDALRADLEDLRHLREVHGK